MLHVASVCTPCCMLLRVVAESLKLVKLFSQQLPTFLLFRDRRSVVQRCWIRLHSSYNIVWGRAPSLRMVYKDLWVVSFPRCSAGPDIVGTLLHPFVHHCQHARNNSQHCWRNNVGSCCVRLHAASRSLHFSGGLYSGFTLLYFKHLRSK